MKNISGDSGLTMPEPLDITLAFKAIGLSPVLSGSEKRVLTAILDHFNRRTAQCDPSLERIATLLGINRRTVLRAIERCVAIGFMKKVRHGGNFHRNMYIPVWSRFRRSEAEWKARRAIRAHGAKMSPLQCEGGHVAGDSFAPQTNPSNQYNEDNQRGHPSEEIDRLELNAITSQRSQSIAKIVHVKNSSSHQAARDSAQRRWDNDVLRCFAGEPGCYARIVDAMTPQLSSAATDAELKCRGGGLQFIVHEIAVLGIGECTGRGERKP
jgi:DNA-binding MarR family transcriptional regulator